MPILILILVIIGIWLLILLGWILIALLARFFSLIVFYWGAMFLLSGLAGIVVGVVLPLRVLTGRGKAPFWQITPQDLVDGKVMGDKPGGANREYGWDHAWPNYLPHQARQDATAVGREIRQHLAWAWSRARAVGPKKQPPLPANTSITDRLWVGVRRGVPWTLWVSFVMPIFLGYAVGTWASAVVWFGVMGVIGVVVSGVQWLTLAAINAFEKLVRRSARASVKCAHCYGESTQPGYRCSGTDCTVVHWTVAPGPLGLFTRRCVCGQRLPNSVTAASRKLAPVCPFCREDLTAGSGSRQTVQIAMIGSIGAGKSRLLDAMIVESSQVVHAINGSFTPLNDRAEAFLSQARERLLMRSLNPKTQYERPIGLPFLIQHVSGTLELQVMDVAGEAFVNWEETAKLRYLDTANGMMLALDPLALPEINDGFRRSKFMNNVILAEGDQEEAYGSAVDRMRAEGLPLGRRGLAVVLTKGDILTQLPVGKSLVDADSDALRSWLIDNGSDLLVRRFEKDFREVRYFLVDSMKDREQHDPMNPWWALAWLLTESKSTLRLTESLAATVEKAPAASAAATV